MLGILPRTGTLQAGHPGPGRLPSFRPIPNSLTLRIDGTWRAFDFEQLFESVDYLNKLSVIALKLRADQPDMRLDEQFTRSNVVKHARLHYYLAQHEELQVRKVEFSSPGLVKFSGVASVTKELRIFIQYLISLEFVRSWVNIAHDIRKEFGIGAVEKQRKALMLAKLIAQTEAVERDRLKANALTNGPNLLSAVRTVQDLDRKGLADAVVTVGRLIYSVERLHHLGYDLRKNKDTTRR
jgi:hypothetical protein